MAELLIAIVILGIGMLMAATMFPIAWSRARDLAEFTVQSSASEAAETTVRMLCNVANTAGVAGGALVGTSFLGDQLYAVDTASPPMADGRVHVLHVQNLLAEANASDAIVWDEWSRDTGAIAPRPQESATLQALIQVDKTYGDLAGTIVDVLPTVVPVSQIEIHERMMPPMEPYPTGSPPPDPVAFDRWETQFANRRFAWAVLYKFNSPDAINGDDVRDMTFYFVTLRRTQATHRYARQDDSLGANSNTMTPQALGPDEDMRLPVPWLVNLKIVGYWDSGTGATLDFNNDPTRGIGIPSEAIANEGGAEGGRLIAQMIQRGSVLVDYKRGAVYTVNEHRYTGTGTAYDYEATLTLDREVVVADIDSDAFNTPTTIEPDDDNRDFWVFPPAVIRPSPDDAFPAFDGKQPVVSVVTRQMFFAPP
jgi:hypothetical protein